MRALVFNEDGGYAVVERPMPEPDAGEVLFRTHYSGICGTDLHAVELGRYTDDVVIGHEFAGEVASVGPGVADWRAGDRAAVHPKGNVCGACPECRDGLPNLCSATDIGGTAGIGSDGGMASYVSLPGRQAATAAGRSIHARGRVGGAGGGGVARRNPFRVQGGTARRRRGRGTHRAADRDTSAAWRRKRNHRAGSRVSCGAPRLRKSARI